MLILTIRDGHVRALVRYLRYAGGDFVCPGATTGSQRVKMHWPKLLIFFWLSISHVSIYPNTLSLSHVAKPSRCNSQV